MKNNLLAKRYRLLKLIGHGGMADVYLALDEILNREVAIKVMKGELTDDVSIIRFKREAMATTKLIHPNIVEVYDVGQEENRYFIVMEYVKGDTLKKLINKRKVISINEAVFIMKQLVNALKHAHESGIIHRDIKPQNIIIKDDGTLKILDFGIALAHDAMQITTNNSVLGSVHYLAPELSKGDGASFQSDIYSLGVVFYELLSGTVPYKADNPIDIAIQHLNNEFPSIKNVNCEIPQSVENIIFKCVMKDPKNRYLNIQKLENDLDECLSDKNKNMKKIKIDKVVTKLKKDKKEKNVFVILFSFLVFLFSLFLIFLILYISGVIEFGDKKIVVPNIKNLTVLQAQEILQNSGLSIDLSKIERTLTDDVDKGKIIEFTPEENSEVNKGTKIKVIVSDGKYAIINDYIGRNILEVKDEIKNEYKYINIIEQVENDNEVEAGTIIKQELLIKGDKVDPNVIKDIKLIYVAFPSVIIPHNIYDMNIDQAKDFFDKNKIKYVIQQYDRSLLNKEQIKKLEPGMIVDISPKPGISYSQQGANVVVIKYY